jgi:hypothetical protein
VKDLKKFNLSRLKFTETGGDFLDARKPFDILRAGLGHDVVILSTTYFTLLRYFRMF